MVGGPILILGVPVPKVAARELASIREPALTLLLSMEGLTVMVWCWKVRIVAPPPAKVVN